MGFLKKVKKGLGLQKHKPQPQPQIVNQVQIPKQENLINNNEENTNKEISKSKEDLKELENVNYYQDKYSLFENLSIIESNYHTKEIKRLDENLNENQFYNINEIGDDYDNDAYNNEIQNNSKNYPTYEICPDELWITKPIEHIKVSYNYYNHTN